MRTLTSVVFLVLGAVAPSLVTACRAPTVTAQYSEQLSKLVQGDSIETFHRVVPDAVPSGQRVIDGHSVNAYEIVYRRHWKSSQRLSFYFCDGRLFKWGEKAPWPEAAELSAIGTAR